MAASREGLGEGIVRELGVDLNTPLCLKWITTRSACISTGNSAHCPVAAWMGGEFGGEWIHVYVRQSPLSYTPETITTLLISYIPV